MSFSFETHAGVGQGWISGHNDSDADGNPAGGYVTDEGAIPGSRHASFTRFKINWQDGPLNREERDLRNGAFVEDVLRACQIRIDFYQHSRFECESNAKAREHIKLAIEALEGRTADRQERGVEGKNEV